MTLRKLYGRHQFGADMRSRVRIAGGKKHVSLQSTRARVVTEFKELICVYPPCSFCLLHCVSGQNTHCWFEVPSHELAC